MDEEELRLNKDAKELRLNFENLESQLWLDVGNVRPKLESLTSKELKRWQPSSSNEIRQTSNDRLSIIYRDILMNGVCWKYAKAIDSALFERAMSAMFKMQTFPDMPYAFTLAVGEAYENAIVALFIKLGVKSARYRQTGVPKRLLRAFQRDIYIRDDAGNILNVELKALRHGSYLDIGILVGDVRKWDDKRFPVAVCMIVNQDTGKILWTEADKAALNEWPQHQNKYGASYIVPYNAWKRLSELIAALK
jgi:hypothetical protein